MRLEALLPQTMRCDAADADVAEDVGNADVA